MCYFQTSIFSLFVLFGFLSCTPTVKLKTPEPVKIDVNMNVQVTSKESPTSSKVLIEKNKVTPQESRRKRMKEVQELKNDRRVGEGRDGFLRMVHPPEKDDYRAYAEHIIQEENNDRKALFEQQAAAESKDIAAVIKEFANRAIQSSFKGEWVEETDGTWKQK